MQHETLLFCRMQFCIIFFPFIARMKKKSYFHPNWEERLSYHLRVQCYFPCRIKKSIWVRDPFHPTASPFSLLYADEPYQFPLAQKDAPTRVHILPHSCPWSGSLGLMEMYMNTECGAYTLAESIGEE